MLDNIKLLNKKDELLDVLIEGKEDASHTIIFVHGFATDKHETAFYFDDIAVALKNNYRIIRFDFSGCGFSQGQLQEKDYQKWADDLDVILDYVKTKYQTKIYIIAQSMGCFITSLLDKDGIEKTIFTGIPNDNIPYIIDHLFNRFGTRQGGKIDMNGVSYLPRSTGIVQKIGPTFWQVLKSFNPLEAVTIFSKKTNLLIIHPKQDEVVGDKYLESYKNIPHIKEIWLNGNHAFSKKEDRKILIAEITNFFLS